jgi:hypothetical protein
LLGQGGIRPERLHHDITTSQGHGVVTTADSSQPVVLKWRLGKLMKDYTTSNRLAQPKQRSVKAIQSDLEGVTEAIILKQVLCAPYLASKHSMWHDKCSVQVQHGLWVCINTMLAG